MTYSTSTTATYRKTRNDEWVVMAPAADLQAGRKITVTKKDGTRKDEKIAKVGKTFEIDGVDMAYGYIASEMPATPARFCDSHCDECGTPVLKGTPCWETGLTH